MGDRSISTSRVLVVDDDRMLADTTSAALDHYLDNIKVDPVYTGEKALDRLEAMTYQCIITDYNMPGMTGVELTKRIRDRYPALPIILYTWKDQNSLLEAGLDAGLTDYVHKSSGSDHYSQLASQVRNYIERNSTRRDLER